MKQLLFLCLLVFFSCTNGNDYVSIRQIDSHHPITVGIVHDTITYIDFPLAFQQLSKEAQKLLRKQIKICPDNGEVKIGSIQQLRKKDKKLISSFLQNDSIFFTFSHRDFSNNYMIDDIYMPVEIR